MTPHVPSPRLDIVFVALVGVPEAHGVGGLQSVVANQARWLVERGHRVRLVTTDHPDGLLSEVRDGVEVLYLPVTKRDPSRFRVADWHRATTAVWPALLAGGRLDIVHGHAEAELGLVRAGLVGPGARIPVIATLYGSPLSGVLDHLRIGPARVSGPRGWWQAFKGALGVLPTFARRRDYHRRPVIALSRRQARLVRLSYGPPAVEVITPGVDVRLFSPADDAARRAARATLGLPATGIVWAFVGRLGFGKGGDLAVQAFGETAGEHDRLIVVGDGPEEAALRALARVSGAWDKILFIAALDPPLTAYHAADAVLFPTRHEESFGLVAAEAMACGLPVLASRRGAVPEVAGQAGLLLPADDLRAWCAAIRRLALDAALRTELAAAARRRVTSCFAREQTVDALERHYAAILATAVTR